MALADSPPKHDKRCLASIVKVLGFFVLKEFAVKRMGFLIDGFQDGLFHIHTSK